MAKQGREGGGPGRGGGRGAGRGGGGSGRGVKRSLSPAAATGRARAAAPSGALRQEVVAAAGGTRGSGGRGGGGAGGVAAAEASRALKRQKVQQLEEVGSRKGAGTGRRKQLEAAVVEPVAGADAPRQPREQVRQQQQQQHRAGKGAAGAKAAAAAAKGAAGAAAAAAANAAAAAAAAAAVLAGTAAVDADVAAAAAASGAVAGGAAKPASGAVNSNWEAMKQAVAAAKKPPPPDHVLQIRRRKAATATAAAAAAAAAGGVAAVTAGGRRPGLVGNDQGLTKVLALDCEMVGVGSRGSESALARVCLINSSGAVLLDTFVQPNEKVTDYRTWVSGVRASDLAGGRPHDDVVQQVGELVKGRVLVGHAIGHDLRALRLEEHPRSLLRDTAKYPGLMKELTGGRKVSASLKDLAATHLGLAIQQGEHSPVDDARAALYLYQKFHREWEAAVRSGQLTPVIGGMGRKAGGGKEGKDRGRSVRGGRRGAAGGKDRAVMGVAAGGVRKHERRSTGKLKGKGGAALAPMWSLESDPYADL